MNHNTHKSDLSRLPMEIHMSIFNFLPPLDIIALRKTCKAIYNATFLRVVWLEALDRICRDNTIYRASFPTEEMTILDLEHITMGPKKWESLVTREDCYHQAPLRTPITTILLSELDEDEDMPQELFLVPGGRFLVATIRGYLSLWDIGFVCAAEPRQSETRLVARRRVDSSVCTTHPSSNGSSMRLLTVTSRSTFEPNKDLFDVLEITPCDSSPDFKIIASLSIATSLYDLEYSTVCEDTVAFVYGPIIKLWDTRINKLATWNTSHMSRQILMNKDIIVLLHDQNCTFWRVPELSGDVRTQLPEPIERMQPVRILDYGGRILSLPDSLSCNGLYDWYTGSPQPLWFDVVEIQGSILNFSRFEAACGALSPPDISIKWISTFQFHASDGRKINPYRVCGNNLVVPWCSSRGIHCPTGHTNKMGHVQNRVTTLRVVDQIVSQYVVSLCPVTGQLVYLSPSGRDIQIVDLFPTRVPDVVTGVMESG